jgi:branched-chain amino acid transport system substrate-binding protein
MIVPDDARRYGVKPRVRRLGLGLAVLAAASWGLAPLPASAAQTFVIGCSLPLSGPEVGFGVPVRQGMQLAVDEFNASNALPGAKFVLDCLDSQDQAQQSVNIAERFVDNPQVIAALSDFSTTSTMAAANTFGAGKLADVSPTASGMAITELNPWMFRSSETIPNYIIPLADLTVKTLGKKRVAVIHVQTDWGETVAETFTKQAAADGGSVIATVSYNPGTTDFRSELTRLRRLRPDAIFLAMLEQDAATFMRQRQEFGMGNITVVDSGVGLTERSLGLAGSAFNGLWADRLFNPQSRLPEVQKFISAFKAKYHTAPDEWGADGYDAAMLVVLAAKRAWPNVTRQTIRDQIAATGTYVGANGPLSIDPKTRALSRTGMNIVRVENGEIVYDVKP